MGSAEASPIGGRRLERCQGRGPEAPGRRLPVAEPLLQEGFLDAMYPSNYSYRKKSLTNPMIPRHRQFDALGDPNRLKVFELLVARPMAVGELAGKLPISRPAVSQHLGLLERAQLVTHVKSGTRNIYRADSAGVQVLRDYLDLLWTQALGDFKVAAEAAYQHTKGRKR